MTAPSPLYFTMGCEMRFAAPPGADPGDGSAEPREPWAILGWTQAAFSWTPRSGLMIEVTFREALNPLVIALRSELAAGATPAYALLLASYDGDEVDRKYVPLARAVSHRDGNDECLLVTFAARDAAAAPGDPEAPGTVAT